ncbi:GreA/GreB family elongation factor [Mycobacterium angelicum]|uniref:Transcription elongation factor GreAB n=1 Tax=Mycobacterium angelicum TaxID=470074 RepID=A0A1W9ZKM4_MYCAN|nr:GreA/GreB family elongation factor [Mycobacterium angelicum]MCV7196164.1 GreA/GreB family elongation factor [Mycobacterium angelicum]ORA17258.1 transcription elongation factor GreAB [Mycobacterium angelicum]
MTTTQSVWMSPQAYRRLQSELGSIRKSRAAAVAAVADGDIDESNGTVQRAWQTRIQRINDLLVNAVVGRQPPDDGVAEPGMVLSVRYDGTGETETFLLGVRDAEYGDLEVYSTQSPLGAAITGARPGERRTYTLPSGDVLSVTLLKAVPYGICQADG